MACSSGQYIYVTGLFNFFFVPQDLIDRVDSYFQRIAFQRNFLLAPSIQGHMFFSMKTISLHWNGSAGTCKEKLWQKVTGEYQMSYLHSFKERVILLCQSILEIRRISHLLSSALLKHLFYRTSPDDYFLTEIYAFFTSNSFFQSSFNVA